MIRRLIAPLALATALSLITVPAFGATLTANFSVDSASIVDLYSATFDGSLIPCTGAETDPDECTFFNGNQPAPRNISIASSPANTSSGTFNVNYDSVTGNILQVNSMRIDLPDAVLTIDGTLAGGGCCTVVTVTQGNGVPTANDTLFIESGTGAPNGTADAHQIRALAGSAAGLFEHNDAPNLDAPDFATFNDIVDSCVGGLCALIGILNLDGNKYRILGGVNALGGDTFQVQAQTGNNSIYKINFTTAVVPVPAAAWLFGSALGLLGWIRSRARA